MVSPAQWDRELIAHLAAECTALRNSEVVGVRGSATANQTRMLGDSLDVIPVTNPAWLRKAQYALIDRLGPRLILWLPRVPFCLERLAQLGITGRKVCQSRFEGILHPLGVGCHQFVLFTQAPMRPHCSVIAGAKIVEFDDQSIA